VRTRLLDLTPPQVGLLRLVEKAPGQSQQSYAARLGMPPSRFVALVDDLEERGLLERRRGEPDRRSYALHLTAEGRGLYGAIGKVMREHENDLCAALSTGEHAQLRDLLARVADQQGLTPGVHPGYRGLNGRR
jgi:DNA-binding MarR family transcriptional regulator